MVKIKLWGLLSLLCLFLISSCIKPSGGFSKELQLQSTGDYGYDMFLDDEAKILEFLQNVEANTPATYFGKQLDNYILSCDGDLAHYLDADSLTKIGFYQNDSLLYQTTWGENYQYYNKKMDFSLNTVRFVSATKLNFTTVDTYQRGSSVPLGTRMTIAVTMTNPDTSEGAASTVSLTLQLVKIDKNDGEYVLIGNEGGYSAWGSATCPDV